jgi:hypothetical protein
VDWREESLRPVAKKSDPVAFFGLPASLAALASGVVVHGHHAVMLEHVGVQPVERGLSSTTMLGGKRRDLRRQWPDCSR